MRVLLLLVVAGLAAGGRLENAYLPPANAELAGGQNLPLPTPAQPPLQPPSHTEAFVTPSNAYLPPVNNIVTEARLQQPPKPVGNVGIVRQQGLQSTLGFGSPAPLLGLQQQQQHSAKFTSQSSGFSGHSSLPQQTFSQQTSFAQQQSTLPKTSSFSFGQQQSALGGSLFGSQQQSFVPKTSSFGAQQSFVPKTSSFGAQQSFSQPAAGAFNAQSSSSSRFASQQSTFQPSAPAGQAVAILRSSNVNNGDGRYAYSYATENDIEAQEQGELRQGGAEGVNTVQGGFAFSAPDSDARFTVTYTADENGFRAFGEHLPTPPPIPEAILRSIELNAREEAQQQQQGYRYQQATTTAAAAALPQVVDQRQSFQQQGFQQQAFQQGFQQQSPRPFQLQASQQFSQKSFQQPAAGYQQQQGQQGYQYSGPQRQQGGAHDGYRY